MEDFLTELSTTNIFKGITPAELKRLLQDKPFRLKEYGMEDFIAYERDVCDNLLILVRGSVRGEMTDFSDKKLKIEDIIAPSPLAAAFVFGRENFYPVDIIANEPAVVMVIPRDVLIFLLQASRIILQNYLNTISSRTQFLSNRIRFLSFKTIREKMAHFILTNTGKDQRSLHLNQSQSELADFFGVTRPSLARTLTEMKTAGILRAERKELIILDREKLNKLLHN